MEYLGCLNSSRIDLNCSGYVGLEYTVGLISSRTVMISSGNNTMDDWGGLNSSRTDLNTNGYEGTQDLRGLNSS